MATYTRTNVYANGGTFSDPTILWYARGVRAMNARQLADPLGWRFYAGIHGFDRPMWTALGYLKSSDKLPSSALQKRFWKQCQHGSWYFPPWHRGYLLALEACIRDEVVKLGGPKTWALPYWNYFGPNNENQLPPAFSTPAWPDGKTNNPLFIKQRYGPNDDGNVFIPLDQVNLNAMTVAEYTGVSSGGDPGFGGVDTGFEHGGSPHGDLESQPHDYVHVFTGGSNPKNNLPGLMSDPDTAGLDPIFYLHHANIDRLWEVWIQGTVSQGNPKETSWKNGPAGSSERAFSMPLPPKGAPWNYTPGQMADLSKLDYTYDDVTSAAEAAAAAELASVTPEARLERLRGGAKPAGDAGMAKKKQKAELVGASEEPVRISGRHQIVASVQMDERARGKVSASLSAAATESSSTPDRVFLNLENIRGLHDATAFKVYVHDRLAGTIALFGLRKASAAGGAHAGQGITHVLEITKIVDELHLSNALDVAALDVRIVPVKPAPDEAQVTIGRISIFRQGQ